MRVRGDFWGVGGARVRHQRVLCHRGVLSRFSAFRKFSPTPLPSVAIPPASDRSSPQQPAPRRPTPRLSRNDVSALSNLPAEQSVVPTHSTPPPIVFRPPTPILAIGRTAVNRRPHGHQYHLLLRRPAGRPIREQLHQLHVHPRPARLRSADQQHRRIPSVVQVTPLKLENLADPQASPPHDQPGRPRLMMISGRQCVQQTVHLLSGPVMGTSIPAQYIQVTDPP